MATKLCPSCRTRLIESAAFCTYCGLRQAPLSAQPVKKSGGIPQPVKIGLIALAVVICSFVALAVTFAPDPEGTAADDTSAAAAAQATNTPAPTSTPVPLVNAVELAAAYDGNQLAADRQYKGKVLRITGVVDSVSKDILGKPYVSFETGFLLNDVVCYFGKSWMDRLSTVQVGRELTVQGEMKGVTLFVVHADDCSLPD